MKITMMLLALAGLVLVSYAHPAPEFGIDAGVKEDGHGGARPSVVATQAWESADKKTRAEVYANWERSYGGHMHGDRSHGFGFKVGGSFKR